MVPNVGVNMCSPMVGIPIHIFAIGTFVGLMPSNIVHIKTSKLMYKKVPAIWQIIN
jgi:hypothetical protein